ncbi:MAG: amino acid adenylation domain-containing protein [Moraxellaceae bacterium]|nr:amino acid adenylation domain-containing protein [Moraxellaceae bacterium]
MSEATSAVELAGTVQARPLTEAQAGIWYAQRLAPENPAYNTAHILWIDGDLDVAAFVATANRAAQEAPALSLRIRDEEGGPQQWEDADYRPAIEVVDLGTDADPAATARAQMRADYLSPVDPGRDRLAQQRLFVLGPQRFAWYLRVHHLVTDGYGMALFSERVCALYGAADAGSPLGPLAPVFDEDTAYRASDKRVRDAAYWREHLAGVPAASGLGPGFAPPAAEALRLVRPLDASLRERLLATAARLGQPWPDLVTALTADYCRRHAGVAEAVLGVPAMGRLGSASASVPAMVMNVLPLRVAQSSAPVEEFVRSVGSAMTRARRHGRYRSEQLRRDLGLVGAQRRLYGPLINVQPFYQPLLLRGVALRTEILSTGPVDDVTLGFRGDAKTLLDLEVEANPSLYTPAQLEAHGARLPAFLHAALAACDAGRSLDDVPLATPAETEHFLYAVNDTAHEVPDTTLVALYEAQMAATPDAPALEFEGEVLSYAQLEQRSRALALQLRAQGVGRESVVALALPRSLELVIALLAVQRAGGAYLPLDLAHPDARLARILDSAQPACVLAFDDAVVRFPGRDVLTPAQWSRDSAAALDADVQPQDAAYVIYTSGSTGEPKGVLIEHRAIVNRLEWMRTHYAIGAGDRILQKTPATFDVSVWEFFLPCLCGATLVVAPPDAHRDPRAIAQLIRQRNITTLHFVPSMLSAFLAAPDAQGLSVQRVFVSGEELGAELRDRFHATMHGELHNLYGPTEAAVDVSYWPAGPDDRSRPVPIGFPVWNTRLYVLDGRMRPLPPGVVGDLYLGGVQLARGYLGRADLTAERFLDDPFVPGARIYRSGDVARWRADGAVEFLGRSDHQIKLRGLRIELGEIEAAVRSAPGVARAEVMLRDDRLVAYLQGEGGAEIDEQVLRSHVAARVPDYMVPSAFVALADWPLTANGKLDRGALPAPAVQMGESAPRTPTERELAALYAQVLELDAQVGAEADFFGLGGDSLSAVRLLMEIQKRWRCDPGLGALFATPTVAALAALIDAQPAQADHGLAPLIRLAPEVTGSTPLFAVHPAGGIAWNYRDLARALSPARTVYGLQSPALDLAEPLPESIAVLAADYADRIATVHAAGPVHLVGWSVGGIIAQAMAVELERRGREVGVLALLDAYPAECWRAEPEPTPVAALRALLAIAGYDPEAHPELDTRERVIAFLRRGDSALGNLPEPVLDGVVRAVTGTNRLVRGHHHVACAATVLHIRAGRDHATRPHLQSSLWAPYTAKVEAVELPFLHAEMTGRDAVARIAPLLSQQMSRHADVTKGNA